MTKEEISEMKIQSHFWQGWANVKDRMHKFLIIGTKRRHDNIQLEF